MYMYHTPPVRRFRRPQFTMVQFGQAPPPVQQLRFVRIVSGGIRGSDNFGNGAYGASRDGGARAHQGVDLVARSGEAVFSPIPGTIIREAQPYPDDNRYRGLSFKGAASGPA